MGVSALVRAAFALEGLARGPVLSTLIFHRVHPEADELFPTAPDAARFSQIMEFVASAFQVMTLGDAVRALENDTLPRRALVITFDDGYADNVEIAMPIMKKVGVPGTFFVSTGFLDGGRMWNDTVIECVRRSRLPEIDLTFLEAGRVSIGTLCERRMAVDVILPKLKYLGLAERNLAIERLRILSEVDLLPPDLMMTTSQLRRLSDAGMEIGGHTVWHPILSSVPPEVAEREIREGRSHLQEIVGKTIDVFAYPNGKPGRDFQAEHVAMVRRLGFRGAVTTAPGVGVAGDDVFQIPRFTPWGDSLLAWSARLFANLKMRDYAKV
jgi:peptidoglycan/xylan/chitin deacetylase (PgdA/CDA1 family)